METVAPRLQRSDFYAHTPNALQALQAVESSGLDMALTEIVNARVSQMNGWAFCIGGAQVLRPRQRAAASLHSAIADLARQKGLPTR